MRTCTNTVPGDPATCDLFSRRGHIGRVKKHHIDSFVQAEGCAQVCMYEINGQSISLERAPSRRHGVRIDIRRNIMRSCCSGTRDHNFTTQNGSARCGPNVSVFAVCDDSVNTGQILGKIGRDAPRAASNFHDHSRPRVLQFWHLLQKRIHEQIRVLCRLVHVFPILSSEWNDWVVLRHRRRFVPGPGHAADSNRCFAHPCCPRSCSPEQTFCEHGCLRDCAVLRHPHDCTSRARACCRQQEQNGADEH